MARKNKPPSPTTPDIIDTTATTPPTDVYTQFLAAVGAEGRGGRVKVYRVQDGKRFTLADGVFDASTFDDQQVAKKFGGGAFFAQMIGADGVYGRGASFDIAGKPKAEPEEPVAPPAPPAPPPIDRSAVFADALNKIVDRLERVENLGAVSQQVNPADMFKAAAEVIGAAMRSVQPAAPVPPTPTQDLNGLISIAEKLASRMIGGVGKPASVGEGEDAHKETGLGALIADVVGRVLTAANKPATAQPATPAAPQLAGAAAPQKAAEVEFEPLGAAQAAVLELVRAVAREEEADRDLPVVAASIVSVLGAGGAGEWASNYLNPNPIAAPLLARALQHYAPDLVPHAAVLRAVAQQVIDRLTPVATQ